MTRRDRAHGYLKYGIRAGPTSPGTYLFLTLFSLYFRKPILLLVRLFYRGFNIGRLMVKLYPQKIVPIYIYILLTMVNIGTIKGMKNEQNG
jgi:hypothetical protein